MEIKFKIIVKVVIIVLVLVVISIMWMKCNVEFVTINSTPATYAFHFRVITSGYFRKIKKGTTMYELKDAIGEPNGAVGSGIVTPYYETIDGKYALIIYNHEDPKTIIAVKLIKKRGSVLEDTIVLTE